ncbi:MAG: hypothetical protein JW384_02321 [Nitrosomonadaceae bacterium]|nr:hypothetical protein [Nitrosomonadaceae bacterium]
MPASHRISLTHSEADTMSISTSQNAYSNESSSEIAFFLKGEWVVTPIEYFAKYHDHWPSYATTAVYGWVPNELIESFLDEYRAATYSPQEYWVTVRFS